MLRVKRWLALYHTINTRSKYVSNLNIRDCTVDYVLYYVERQNRKIITTDADNKKQELFRNTNVRTYRFTY
jgi:predicted nuclease of predicted toxin-antitoxin system